MPQLLLSFLRQVRQEYTVLMGCHIQHNQIYHKYDQCRTKVFRYHQDQHVKSSYDRRHYEIFKFRRTLKLDATKNTNTIFTSSDG